MFYLFLCARALLKLKILVGASLQIIEWDQDSNVLEVAQLQDLLKVFSNALLFVGP
jgi:hypothetical protein